jgi:hypothetical protein
MTRFDGRSAVLILGKINPKSISRVADFSEVE